MSGLYGMLLMVQRDAITAHCFGDCGKAIVGGVVLDETAGPMVVCRQDTCPHLDRQIDRPCGEVDGEPLTLRKLKDVERIDLILETP